MSRWPWAEPLLVFVLALLVTGGLVLSVANAIRRQDRLAFEYEIARSIEAITQRITVTSNLLRGAVGLFDASRQVEAGEFRRYVGSLDLDARYPGILGIGYSRRLAPSEVAPFEASVRAAGRPGFRVWPGHPRDEYHSIVYLEPMNRRNAAAIGFDMSTEPVRHAAMAAARARGDLVASGKVTLVQEIDRDKQSGFLMYLPVYARDDAGRAGALQGFVYAPLRAGDLLHGTRGPGKRIDFEVFDGAASGLGERMHTTIDRADPPSARFVSDRVIDVAGRPWRVRYYSRPELDALSRRWLVPWLGLAALAASALLAFLSHAQGRARRTAEAAAGEQRQAARTLHREREWLGATLTSIGDGVIAVDAHERVTWMNPVAERLTGWHRDEALGHALRDVVQAASLGAGAGRTESSLPGEHGHGEAMLHARDGTVRPVEHSSAPIRDPHGAVSGAVTVMRDASERYRIEAELRENDRRKDEFLAMLAHELRNPLAPISTAARLLRMPTVRPEQVREASEMISRQAAHMTELVDELLDVSRVTRGLIVLEREVFDLRDAIAAAVEQVAALMASHGHALDLRIDETPLWVDGDRTRLTQVLANLFDNAAKYTPPAGRITVEAARAGDAVRVDVRDTGIGIGAELRARVFDLFSQGDRPLDRAQGGLGIGLALVRSVVELHGGAVRVDSAGTGQGSVFTVELPAAEAAQARPDEPAPAAGAERRPLRIAIVDDNDDALQATALLLESQGHRVRTFGTAELALQAADDDPAEVYLLDIGLPGMNGHELARRLRVHPRAAHSALFALSGYGQASDRAASHEAGFDEHFVKPVDPERLLRRLAAVHREGAPG